MSGMKCFGSASVIHGTAELLTPGSTVILKHCNICSTEMIRCKIIQVFLNKTGTHTGASRYMPDANRCHLLKN
jgi:hypothetical protein